MQSLICCHFFSFKTQFLLPKVVWGDLAIVCVCGSVTTVRQECQLQSGHREEQASQELVVTHFHTRTHKCTHTHTHHSLREKSETIKEDFAQCQTCSSHIPFSWSFYTLIHVHTLSSCVRTHTWTTNCILKVVDQIFNFPPVLTKASHQDKLLLLTTVQRGPAAIIAALSDWPSQ